MRGVAWPTVFRRLHGLAHARPPCSARLRDRQAIDRPRCPGAPLRQHRFDVAVVVRAAADVARHARACTSCVRRMRIRVQQRLRAHELPRCAEAALRRVVLHEGLLQRIELAVLRQALDRLRRSRPSAHTARWLHEYTGLPSSSTVHAPHSPRSQPILVPVSPR